MKHIITGFICILSITNGLSQSSIKGKVNGTGNNPLPGTTVFLPEFSKGTICNDDGIFFIEKLPTGKVKVQFSFTGFNTEIKAIELKPGINELSITLPESSIEMEEVVVTGGSVSAQRDNAVKIEVLNRQDIQFSGTPNLMESLSEVPGVEMISMGPGVSKPVVRGRSLTGVLVLKNGVRIENYQYNETHPVGIDDNSVERVEVIKGPASLLYGSDAMGGVVNFIKEKPAHVGKIQGDYQAQMYSNTLGLNNSIGIKGASKQLFGGLRASYKTHADYKQGGGDFVPNTRFNEWSLSTHTGYTGQVGTFKLYYDYLKQNIGMVNSSVLSTYKDRGRNTNLWYQDLSHHMVSSRNKLFFKKLKWENNVAFQSALRKAKREVVVPFVEMRLNTLTYESKLHFLSGEGQEYIAGIQGMYQWHRNRNNRKVQSLPDAEVNNVGFFMLTKHKLIEGVNLQGGLRYDFYKIETEPLGQEGTNTYHAPESKDFSGFNGSIGLTWELSPKLMMRANLAKAWRVPNLREFTFKGQKGNRYEIGNFELDPEDAYEGDLSLHFNSRYLTIDLTGFYNHIDDYIYLAPTNETTGNGLKIYRILQTNAKLYGGEAAFHFHPVQIPWLHVKAVYTSVTGERQSGDYLPLIPASKLRYEVGVEKDKIGFLIQPGFKLSALSAFQQDKPYQFETITDGYTLVNAGIDSKLKIGQQLMTVGLRANNIFDKKYYDHLSVFKPMKIYNPGRNLSLFLKVPFST